MLCVVCMIGALVSMYMYIYWFDIVSFIQSFKLGWRVSVSGEVFIKGGDYKIELDSFISYIVGVDGVIGDKDRGI